jgi:hypothetical protein
MNIHDTDILKVLVYLLDDVRTMTGVRIELPNDVCMETVYKDCPALDKLILCYLEHSEYPDVPEWISPLWAKFLETKDPVMLRALRQVLAFGYKAKSPHTNEQVLSAQKAFEDANHGCLDYDRYSYAGAVGLVARETRRELSPIIAKLDFREITPSHGPGAVMHKERASEKSRFLYSSRICDLYPYDKYFNLLPFLGEKDLLSQAIDTDCNVSRMVAVPKDSRGPRLISVHSKESVWIQQGQRRSLEHCIESHPLTRGRINFADQSVNGRLALQSSIDRVYTTIDMKEASDRVTRGTVQFLFGGLWPYLDATRADRIRLLDNRLVPLHMYAPMGNATTFPVEALVFWASIRAGIRLRHGVSCDAVYVFGDDIIVPSSYYDGAIYGLCSMGLIPNASKTFRKGFFRESCGVDAYHGIDVTPHRWRASVTLNSYSDLISACDLAKRFRISGYDRSATELYRLVRQRFPRLNQSNNPDSQGIVEYVKKPLHSFLRSYYDRRAGARKIDTFVGYDSDLQRFYTHNWVLKRDEEQLRHHAWWHVQDSLFSIQRRGPCVDGLGRESGYPSPRGERLTRGVTELLHL